MNENNYIKNIIEAALLISGDPINICTLQNLFEGQKVSKDDIKLSIEELSKEYEPKAIEIKEISLGYRIQVKASFAENISSLWKEKPRKISRALLETLSIIVYKQPVTRAEVESIRGVTVSSFTMKILIERKWIKVLSYKNIPGKPAVYGTTDEFLKFFNLKSLQDLPSISTFEKELRHTDKIKEVLEVPVE